MSLSPPGELRSTVDNDERAITRYGAGGRDLRRLGNPGGVALLREGRDPFLAFLAGEELRGELQHAAEITDRLTQQRLGRGQRDRAAPDEHVGVALDFRVQLV